MIGQFLALLTAISSSGNSALIRRAVFRIGEPNAAFYISVFVGMIIFSLALAFSGDAGQLTTASGKALAFLVGASIIGGVMGRWLSFNGLKLIGANLSSPFKNTSTVVSVILGITLMGESVTLGKALGIGLIVIGAVLISSEGGDTAQLSRPITGRDMVKGIASATSAGICWGISPVLTKVAIDEGNSPIMAAFVINAIAMVLVLVILSQHGERRKLRKVDRGAFIPVLSGSIFATIAQFCRYSALDYSPVSVVIPLLSTATLITILLSYAFNRKIELFTWKIIVGAILVVNGVFFIFQV
jgi:drug/metabolite transporter (DMT)-like permease